MKKSLVTLTLLSVLGLAGCQEQVSDQQSDLLTVSTYQVGTPVKTQYRVFKGQVVAAEQTPIAFRTSGEILQVLVRAGDRVKQGQLLVKLDDSKQKQVLEDTKAKHALALKQHERGKELFERAMISQAELDELMANRQLANAEYQLAKNQMEYTRLLAPFTGTVTDVFKERYERPELGEPILSLYQDDKVYVQIELSDNVLAKVNPDRQLVTYQPKARFSGVEGEFSVHYLEYTSEPDPQSRSYTMWLAMDQISPPILPGTSASIGVDMQAAGITSVDGYQLPMTSLDAGRESGEFFVWKLYQGQVTRVAVKVSQINGQGAIISSGITSGDVVVNSNLRKLREGKTVKMVESNQ
nr:efflux RND transporter periplasmic adaptor subunit [Vibrio cidicii]